MENQRATIESQQDTAQSNVNAFLKTISTTEQQIRFPSFHGRVHLETLRKTHPKVTHLEFSTGDITYLGLPEGITHCRIPQNLLVTLSAPKTLKELVITHNGLHTLDVSALKKLEILNVSQNRLTVLKVPASLKQLYANENKLTYLSLPTPNRLETLHVRGNPGLVVTPLPKQAHDIQIDNRSLSDAYATLDTAPMTAVLSLPEEPSSSSSLNTPEELDVVTQLHHYFRDKRQYELKNRNHTHPPKCIWCQKPGGTRFHQTIKEYSAECLATPKCDQYYQIPRQLNYILHDQVEESRKEVYSYQTKIIRLKLDTLFRYVSEKDTKTIYPELLEEYNAYKSFHERVKQLYANEFDHRDKDNEERRLLREWTTAWETYQKLIQDCQDATKSSESIVHSLVEIEVKLLQPIQTQLRQLRYGIMEMDTKEETRNQYSHKLRQYPFRLYHYTQPV